jgi:hypothetical protein
MLLYSRKSKSSSLPYHCHMIFDIKMEDFWHMAQLVVKGHVRKALATLTYARIMSRETVHIAPLLAALNDVDI